MMLADPVLRIRGLRKAYGGVVAVDGLDLDLARGEVLGLLGHNGAGKTTLISSVAGLRRPDAGTITIDGVDLRRDPVAVRRRLGLAPQETAIYPDATVHDNLRVFGALAGLRRRALRRAIEQTAPAFGLDALMHRRASVLSGGQRRRVHTAAAVLHRPPLLLLDEPTVGADVATRDALLELVGDLARDGAGVCYSTHYLPEVEQLGATVAVLHRGRLLARGTTNELVATHASSAVELAFDGDPPALPGATAHADGRLRVPADDPAATAAQLLSRLPADAHLTSLALVRDDLEGAYRALTADPTRHPASEVDRHAEVPA